MSAAAAHPEPRSPARRRRTTRAPTVACLARVVATTLGVLATFGSLGHLRSDPSPSPEDLSRIVVPDPATIRSAALEGSPAVIWRTLESAELVECLDCISYVEPLLNHRDARVRGIAAWWLRRRAFGYVEIATKVRQALQQSADVQRRAAAAEALGAFQDPSASGILRVAAAADPSPEVRRSAIAALQRLQDDGAGPTIANALTDADRTVRRAAAEAALHLPSFSDAAALVGSLADEDGSVRAKAAATLGLMRVAMASSSLLALAQRDPRVDVRIAAVTALGNLGNTALRAELEAIGGGDSASRVRDAAQVALRKLGGGASTPPLPE